MSLLDEFDSLVADVNVYDIFGVCYGTFPYPQLKGSEESHSKMTYYSATDYTPWLKRPLKQGSRKHLKELPPCTWGTPL